MTAIPAAAQLLQLVAEDLRLSDPTTYDALEIATRQGCTTLVQLAYGPEGNISLGYRDDYGKTRWVHAIPLQ